MTPLELSKAIFNVAHLSGEFKLRSGVTSHEYFDKYQFESDPKLLLDIATQLVVKIKDLKYDYLAPLEMGGIPIATAIAIQTGHPLCFVRKKAKEYGTQKFAEGPDIKGKRLLIVEDVVTSGGQIILSTEDLRSEGAIVEDAICVIDRQAGGPEKLKKQNIDLHPLFTMEQIKSSISQ